MLRRALFAAAAGGLFLVVACAEEKPAQSPVDVLKDRATSDLKCPSEEIHTKTVDNRTKIAWGCGKSGTYVQSCEICGSRVTDLSRTETETERCNCTWVLNSPVQPE